MFVYVYPFPFFTYPFCNFKVIFNFFIPAKKLTQQRVGQRICVLPFLSGVDGILFANVCYRIVERTANPPLAISPGGVSAAPKNQIEQQRKTLSGGHKKVVLLKSLSLTTCSANVSEVWGGEVHKRVAGEREKNKNVFLHNSNIYLSVTAVVFIGFCCRCLRRRHLLQTAAVVLCCCFMTK